MSNLKQSAAELRKAGDRLFHRLEELLGPGAINEDRIRERSDWRAVLSVLRSCIRREMPAEADMKLLNQALKAQSITLTAERGKTDAIRIGMWGQLWVTIHHLTYYANCLADDPRLKAYEPIGICNQCNNFFVKRRMDQEFCKTSCRFEAFAEKKGKTYFAEKARNNRAARRALNRKRRS